MKLRFVWLGISAVLVFSATAQQQLTIDQVMSSDELKSTGVSTLSQTQQRNLIGGSRATLTCFWQRRKRATNVTQLSRLKSMVTSRAGPARLFTNSGMVRYGSKPPTIITITMPTHLR